jgi:two-component system sensor histidine kinase FlrB
MLPSSHLVPINTPVAEYDGEGQFHSQVDELTIDGAFPRQKDSGDDSAIQSRSAVLLAGEFSEFIAAAARLENSYRALQQEVSELGVELSERNAALNTSLAENERMRLALQQIVDSMPCGVLVLDCRGEISMINPESKQLLGLDQKHSGEGSHATLGQISDFSGVNLEASFKNASRSDLKQEFCIRDTAAMRWIEVCSRRLFRLSGCGDESDQTILILRDVTAQKRAEQERDAGRKAMALAEITTILAHEIRNPLASLELFAELIEEDEDGRAEWVSNLRAGIRSLSGTVNNVLSFHGSGSLKLSPLPLSVVIASAIQFVRPLAEQAAVSLEWLTDHDQVLVMGNESGLQQVVLNLVSNAIRHTPAGGSVTVALRLDQDAANDKNHLTKSDHVTVEFSDSGCGLRPDQISRVFEPGFSGRGDTSGLGLAVCERIMKQHGGSISVSNMIHSGARFTLDFPVFKQKLATP